MPTPTSTRLQVNIFDGTRRPISNDVKILTTISDGNPDNHQPLVRRHYNSPLPPFEVPFHNNLWDLYTVLASADGFLQAGFHPVKLDYKLVQPQRIDVMLIPSDNSFNFNSYDQLQQKYPAVFKLLSTNSSGVDDAGAPARYEELQNAGSPLSALFNFTTALDAVHLSVGKPLDYLESIDWEGRGLEQDRFFGWADPELVHEVAEAAAQGQFEKQSQLDLLQHPGATSSYKQKKFGEANLQLTFHELARKQVGDKNCVRVETDIDYFQDLAAHFFLEVIANKFNGPTDPRSVYVLRWIAGRVAGQPEFDPPYTIERQAV